MKAQTTKASPTTKLIQAFYLLNARMERNDEAGNANIVKSLLQKAQDMVLNAFDFLDADGMAVATFGIFRELVKASCCDTEAMIASARERGAEQEWMHENHAAFMLVANEVKAIIK